MESKPPRIIGLSGKFGVGKDTAAAMILYKYPQYRTSAIATNLKKVVSVITGTSIDDQYTRAGKESIPDGFAGKSIGWYQQMVGQRVREIFGEDVWVNSALADLSSQLVITDVRYPNEVAAIKRAGGIVIRIIRDGVELNDGRDIKHISETALDSYDQFDAVIVNNRTLEEFEKELIAVVESQHRVGETAW